MKRAIISILGVLVLVMMALPAVPAMATEDVIVFADDFGNGASIDNVEDWDVPGYADWDDDSDNGGSDAALRASGSNRYLRLRSNDYVEKWNISTAGLENIHLEYTWGYDTDWDFSDDGDLVVQWKLSSASSWTTVNTHNLPGNSEVEPYTNFEDEDLGASAENTSIDIRFWGDTPEDNDQARVGSVTVSGDNAGPTAPTVTINQAGGQADPTSTSPISFDVVFSESVSDFATGDVTLSGTAGATTATVSGSGTTYTVDVTGMSTSGTVIADIPAGVATSLVDPYLTNDASTSDDNQVTYTYVVPNPPLGNTCGLDIVLVMDESSSIDSTEFAAMQSAFVTFVAALADTPTEFALVVYGTNAYIQQGFTDAATITTAINASRYYTGTSQYTNWEQGLLTAQTLFTHRAANPDLIIFASDGDPTAYGSPASFDMGGTTALAYAVTAADGIKTAGTRIVTIGIGSSVNSTNLIAISSADAYFAAADFGQLTTVLDTIASALCGGTITIHKVIDLDGSLTTDTDRITSGAPVQNWQYDFTVTDGSANPNPALTDINGTTVAVDITVTGDPYATVTIDEVLKAGYAFVGISVSNSGSGSNGSLNYGTQSLSGLEVGPNDIVSLTFYNTPACGLCEEYNETTGECDEKDCNDDDPCTVDSCNPNDGECTHTQMDCNDDDPCTTDSCVAGECVNTEIPDCGECEECYEPVSVTIVSNDLGPTTYVTYSENFDTTTPYVAVLAWEPTSDTDPSSWDTQLDYDFSSSGADWIWESYRVQDYVGGDVVTFQNDFTIPAGSIDIVGNIHITCDNGYELTLNGLAVGSAQLGAGWKTSLLTQSYVDTDNWESVESYDISTKLQTGTNTFIIDCANEYMGTLDGQADGTQDNNPAGLIFEAEISYCAPICEGTPTSCGCETCTDCTLENGPHPEGDPYTCCSDDGTSTCTCQDYKDRTYYCFENSACLYTEGDLYTEKTSCTACPDCQECEVDTCVDICEGTVEECGCNECISCDDSDPCTDDSCVAGVCVNTFNAELPGCGCEECYEPESQTIISNDSETTTYVTYSENFDTTTPFVAFLAWEPDPYPTNYPTEPPETIGSTWDTDIDYDFSISGADWIWESHRPVDPAGGDVVHFQNTVTIPAGATNIVGNIHITCDNGYELLLNTGLVGSAQLGAGWKTSNLTEAFVNTNNWQTVESYDISSLLGPGANIFVIRCANEYMGTLDGQDAGTQDNNPAGLIFEIEISYCVPMECPVCEKCVADECVDDPDQNGDYCDTPGSWIDNPSNPCEEMREVWTCDDGDCVSSYEYQNKPDETDCGTDYTEATWVYYCAGDQELRRHQQHHDFYCESGVCTDHLSWANDERVDYCNDYDNWYDTGAAAYACCNELGQACTCQEQEYRDYYCDAPSETCSYTPGATRIDHRDCVDCSTELCEECVDGVCVAKDPNAEATMLVVSDDSNTTTYITAGNTAGPWPYVAVLAWEHPSWLTDLTGHTFSSGAKWIWESQYVVNPEDGDIVTFQNDFYVPGVPVAGTLYITCDNGYEVWLNGSLVGSAQLGAGWETSDLTQPFCDTTNWQSVETWDIFGDLLAGANTLVIYGVNEQLTGGTTTTNPAGLIFEAEIIYDDMCTEDTCNPSTGECEHEPIVCDNCFVCDPTEGCVPKDCDDKDPCTIDDCDTETGECVHTAAVIADAGPDQTIASGTSIGIGGSPTEDASTNGPFTFSWDPITGLNNPSSANPTASPTTTTTYTVTVTDVNQCISTDSMTVTVTPPSVGGFTGAPERCFLIIEMLGFRTTVEIDCCRNTTMEECEAYDEQDEHLLELQDDTLVLCGDCVGCHCYPRIIVMSPSDETPALPEGMTLVGDIYDFTGYKDMAKTVPCQLATYFDPVASVLLNYDPALLPPGAFDPSIGFYSHELGQWVILPPNPGIVAEVGVASGLAAYFASPFAVLASVPPPATPEPPPSNPEPAHFVASSLNITPAEAKAGETVTISLNVTNDGEVVGTYLVELKINGTTLDSQAVTLDGGQSEPVSFTVSASEAGTYEVTVSSLSGSFTVVKSSIWWIYLIIAAAVVIIGGVLVLRFRKKASS